MKKTVGNKLSQYSFIICPCGCQIKRLVRNDRILKNQIYVKGHYHYNNGFNFNKLRNRWVVMDRNNISVHFSRVLAESVLKRELKTEEIVHHIDGDSSDDRKNNLLICLKEYHNWLHKQMRRFVGPWTKDRSYLTII